LTMKNAVFCGGSVCIGYKVEINVLVESLKGLKLPISTSMAQPSFKLHRPNHEMNSQVMERYDVILFPQISVIEFYPEAVKSSLY
jgi:hypothetical protein